LAATDDDVRQSLEVLAKKPATRGSLSDELEFALGGKTAGVRVPPAGLAKGELKNSDTAAGRRVFFHTKSAGCYKCHTVNGRGGRVGPDLSTIGRSHSREKLIESIFEPGREIAPQYVTWAFETAEGKVVTGMIVHENEGKTVV